jgi:hypothetical protein
VRRRIENDMLISAADLDAQGIGRQYFYASIVLVN